MRSANQQIKGGASPTSLLQFKRRKMKIVEYDINDLIAAEYNPRQMTEPQVQGLTDSLKRFGLVDPILVNVHPDRKNIIIGGHQRVRIARELGFEVIPCVELNLTVEKERELNVRLNKNTGEWDWDALANHFDVGELQDWGFSKGELGGGLFEEVDFSDIDGELDALSDFEEVVISVSVPKHLSDEVDRWLTNGERATAAGRGRGVLKRCGLL